MCFPSISVQLITSAGLLQQNNFTSLSVTVSHVQLYHIYVLPSCKSCSGSFKMSPSSCQSGRKAEGNLCLGLSKGGKHSRTDLPAPFLYAEVLTCLTCLQTLHCKHWSFREFNTQISPVNLNKAKEKYSFSPPKTSTGNYLIKEKKIIQDLLDCLSEQGSTRMDLQHSESAHLKNWKGKTNHPSKSAGFKNAFQTQTRL